MKTQYNNKLESPNMTKNEFKESLKSIGMAEEEIKDFVSIYNIIYKMNSHFSFDILLKIAKEAHVEAERNKGSISVDGDRNR